MSYDDAPSVTERADAAAREEGLRGEIGNVEQTCPKVTLEIGVFFDGTNNNATNALLGGGEGSYANSRSNVALLSLLYPNDDGPPNACGNPSRKYFPRYVPGIGTTTGSEKKRIKDSLVGGAIGMGATGVEARVAATCIELGRDITRLSPGVEPEEIIFDVFGISRGAAAARYFVNAFRQGWIRYNPVFGSTVRGRLPEGRKVRIRFVGIFDTVASIGSGTVEYNYGANIHLRTDQADRIFHLTAGSEYRKNFRLNHNLEGGGDHYEMPGVHSDIDGGYKGDGDRAHLGSYRKYSWPH